GYSVGIDGDIAVVGAPQDDFQGFWSGGAYYFLRSGTAWSVGAGLARPEIAAYDNYGNAVDVQGGTAFVGSIRDDSYRGSAYVYFTPKTVVHRFYNPGAGTHFYTDSAEEAWTVLMSWPDIFTYEGVAYTLNPALNTQVLYRFYKPSSASHFYTGSLTERDHVIATWPYIYNYEGTTYSISPAYAVGKPPVYRFYNVRNGSHFYTVSAAEKAHIQATWPHIYTYEGIAFWLGQ
ncbi:MAG: hypothetical protein JXP37_08750, partial [Coriobacteriia bacterium]|nr:hypothetical protein [Coriobacteriia bacterium]